MTNHSPNSLLGLLGLILLGAVFWIARTIKKLFKLIMLPFSTLWRE